MLDENSKSESKIYKSPVQKLFRFFEASRDKWKDKCLTGKYQIKLLTNRIRYLEKCKKDLSNKVLEQICAEISTVLKMLSLTSISVVVVSAVIRITTKETE